jgi:hypothetical protein
VMVVRDKRGEIAILRTLGAAPVAILAIFVIQGAVVGVVGTLVGVVAGVLGAWNVSAISAFIESVTGFQYLAPDVTTSVNYPAACCGPTSGRWQNRTGPGAGLHTHPAWRGARRRLPVLRYGEVPALDVGPCASALSSAHSEVLRNRSGIRPASASPSWAPPAPGRPRSCSC